MIREEVVCTPNGKGINVIAFPVFVTGSFLWKAGRHVPEAVLEMVSEPGKPICKIYGTRIHYAIPCIVKGIVNADLLRQGLDSIDVPEGVDIHLWRP